MVIIIIKIFLLNKKRTYLKLKEQWNKPGLRHSSMSGACEKGRLKNIISIFWEIFW